MTPRVSFRAPTDVQTYLQEQGVGREKPGDTALRLLTHLASSGVQWTPLALAGRHWTPAKHLHSKGRPPPSGKPKASSPDRSGLENLGEAPDGHGDNSGVENLGDRLAVLAALWPEVTDEDGALVSSRGPAVEAALTVALTAASWPRIESGARAWATGLRTVGSRWRRPLGAWLRGEGWTEDPPGTAEPDPPRASSAAREADWREIQEAHRAKVEAERARGPSPFEVELARRAGT